MPTERKKYTDEKPIRHGLSNTVLYTKWRAMMQRCFNPQDPRYSDYGERGVTVCEYWKVFINFYNDMKDGYRAALTLDRIETNGHYEKSNCRWATHLEQQQNRRDNVMLTIHGQSATVSGWSRLSGINKATILWRHKAGWRDEECVYGRRAEELN